MGSRHSYDSLETPWPHVDLEDVLTEPTTPPAGTARPHVKNGQLYLKLDNGDDVAVGGSDRNLFRGQWASVPDELVYSNDFEEGLGEFGGTGAQLAMGSAVGTDKPAYSDVAQGGGHVGTVHDVLTLDLETLPQAVGRTLTKLEVWHGRQSNGFSGIAGIRAVRWTISTAAGISYDETHTVTGGATGLPWLLHTILAPAGTFAATVRNGTGHSTSLPSGYMALTGFALYATPLDWQGYELGDYVVHEAGLWRSTADENLSEPGEPGALWVEVPLGGSGSGGTQALDGIHADRPAPADAPGALYACSTHACTYRSDGATWSLWGAPGVLVIPNGGSVPADTPVGTIIIEEGE